MRDIFTYKRTSRLPSREMTLKSTAVFDLALADSVTFVYRPFGVVGRTEIPAVVLDAPTKRIRVDFGATDVAVLGQFEWHVEVVISSKLLCIPEDGYFTFSVIDQIEA